MKVFRDYREIPNDGGAPRVVTIGNFDGVHLAHRAVLSEALFAADARGASLSVLTFEPHPASLLRQDVPPMRLSTVGRKLELLEACRVDTVLVQRFDREFAALEPQPFAERVLVHALRAGLVVVGDNFRFGAARSGDTEMLRALGRRHGFEVATLEAVDAKGRRISSSRIREALAAGDVRFAASMLGRPHELSGVVVCGKGEGRRLGFATANLGEIDVLVPAAGIYAARCRGLGEKALAAVYIGDRPTLGHGPSIEAHLLDFDGDLYGARLTLELVARIREERRFEDVEALRKQMAKDVARARALLEEAADD